MEKARDRQQPLSTRVAALRAIGGWSDKAAAQTLVDVFTAEAGNEPIAKAAAAGLTFMTGIRENRSAEPAQYSPMCSVAIHGQPLISAA